MQETKYTAFPHPLSSFEKLTFFLQKLVFESSEAVSVVSTFDDLGLKEDLVRGIYAYSMYSFPAVHRSS
jgi:hypothetical protein